jgi:hypothetical protein
MYSWNQSRIRNQASSSSFVRCWKGRRFILRIFHNAVSTKMLYTFKWNGKITINAERLRIWMWKWSAAIYYTALAWGKWGKRYRGCSKYDEENFIFKIAYWQLGGGGGVIPITAVTYHCVCTCFLSAVITMSEQVVPSTFAQRIDLKFLTNKNVKPAEILKRLRAQFDNETLSRMQALWLKSFKEGRTEVENTRRLHLL